MEQRYKCEPCKLILKEEDLEDGKCPECDIPVHKMCERDHCHCSHEIVESIAYCPICGKPCCPICGCEDVEQISRVTGYLGAVSGWSAGKAQELKDRTHYNISSTN